MAKIELDKYYTPPDLAEYIVNKTKEIIGEENITEYLEPSAGAGVFLDYFDKPYLAYDIEPEDDRIIEQDFLKLELDYKKGRCVIGNPPFGSRNTLSVRFYKKAIHLGDYITFILPISQLNNNQQMYEFDLIHSEDLGIYKYTDRELHCCLNIYKKPINKLNKKPDYTLKDVTILEWRRGGNYKIPNIYDYAICAWGASIGKKIDKQGQYELENYIIINNNKYKKQVINVLENANWKQIYPNIATPRLTQWKIYKYLKEQIPELK